jgi:hypothetical protein
MGLFRLIGVLSRSHRFEDPHDCNDPVFVPFPEVPQLVHIRCFWSPVRRDKTTSSTHLQQLIYLGSLCVVYAWSLRGLSRLPVVDSLYVSGYRVYVRLKISFFA